MPTWSVYQIGLGKNATLKKIGEEPTRTRAARLRELARIGESDQFVLYRDDQFVNACAGTGKK